MDGRAATAAGAWRGGRRHEAPRPNDAPRESISMGHSREERSADDSIAAMECGE